MVPWVRSLTALAALAVAVLIWTEDADARAGGNVGNPDSQSFNPPAATPTAPRAAPGLDHSRSQQGRQSHPGGTLGGLFNRPGLMGGFAAGFLGAGLFGLLFGHGLFGGLSGVASLLGLLFQIVLMALLGRIIWSWWSGRHVPAFAGLSPRQLADAYGSPRPEPSIALGAAAIADFKITASDYDVFERLLGEIQAAYGREDLDALARRVTPGILTSFSDDLARNAASDLRKVVSDVKLLQGDLAEAWHEGDTDYATVAMRFSLIDRMVERASGRVVEGSDTAATEANELWSFVRGTGGDWRLAAIEPA